MSTVTKKTTSAHWGSYYSEVKNNKLLALHPYEKDPDPSSISNGMIDAIDDHLRIRKPHVRRGWYEAFKKKKILILTMCYQGIGINVVMMIL